MSAPIKHTVTVGPGGRIELTDPSLPAGAHAQITIELAERGLDQTQLAAFRELQQRMHLTQAQADQWKADVLAERRASNRPR